ncbi:MAG TPA: S9 family peptidase [Thermoanaerobaculia bacterium]|nr:S9 family peptidase [Thermoanaerobaculia bacterium]
MLAPLVLAATLTINDYATMPQLSDPHFSPDGKQIAYVVTRADLVKSAYEGDVWLIGADGSSDHQLTTSTANDTHPRWSPDGTRVAFLSDRDGKTAIWSIAMSGEATKLTSEPTPIRDFAWSPDGKRIAFTRLDAQPADDTNEHVVGANPRYAHLYLLELENKTSRALTSGNFSVWTFDWSPDGATIAFDRATGNGLDDMYRTDIWRVSVNDGTLSPLVERIGIDHQPHYSPDGKWIAFTSSGGIDGWLYEHQINVVSAGGGAPRVISSAYDRTPESIEWSEDSHTIWFDGPFDSTSQLFRVNADDSAFAKVTNLDGVITDADVHHGVAAYTRQTLTDPPELWLDDHQLTHHNDELRTRTLGETRLIRWKNPKDGMTIEGLLTLPAGYTKGTRVPLLTFVHGGPASRFDQSFLGYLGHIYAPQVLAANGFAVLRPNPRGTGGYGSRFRIANRNDWGGMDWLDINAGIDAVIADGIADPQRLGIMGWSYGGFMASWAIGHSDRFRAFSVGAPVVDLLTFHGTTDIRQFIAHYFTPFDLDRLRERSPIWHLKKPAGPVLIQHGEADERVPTSQGIILFRLLEELGADVTMVTYPRTPHVPREPKLRMDVARRNVDFFTRALILH